MSTPRWPKPEATEHWEAICQEGECLPERKMFSCKPDYEFHLLCVECGNIYHFCTCKAWWCLAHSKVLIKDRTMMAMHMRMKYTKLEKEG